MRKRIKYAGGERQQDRMNEDKLRSLKKALLYSYQAATAVLDDKREFRCLMNRDRLKEDYDEKIISIPFEDICLNDTKRENGKVKIGLKVGDIFTWKENNTDWIVLLQYLEETAYFRARVRLCNIELDLDGHSYKAYLRGPDKDTLTWHTKGLQNISWNDIDYDVQLYITKDEFTSDYFHRFSKIKLNGKTFEVQAVDSFSSNGVITVALKETFKNSIQDAIEKQKEENNIPPLNKKIYIDGDSIVYPFDEKLYKIKGLDNGQWSIDNSKIKILEKTSEYIKIYVDTGKTGKFKITYINDNVETNLDVDIKSL